MGYIGRTNGGSVGGGGVFDGTRAVLEIEAPNNAILEISKDGKKVKKVVVAKDGNKIEDSNYYLYLYTIEEKNFGTYTISSNLSGTSKSISVLSFGLYRIIAPERFYLFKSGEGALVPLKTDQESNSSVTVSDQSVILNYTSSGYYQILCINNEGLDLSTWNTFSVTGTITERQTSTDYGGFVIAANATTSAGGMHSTAARIAVLTGSTEQTTVLDISSVTTTTGYVGVVGGMKGTITAMYLER